MIAYQIDYIQALVGTVSFLSGQSTVFSGHYVMLSHLFFVALFPYFSFSLPLVDTTEI